MEFKCEEAVSRAFLLIIHTIDHLFVDALKPNIRTRLLGYRLFQSFHVPDIKNNVRPFREAQIFDSEDVNISSEGICIPSGVALRIINTLTAEFNAL